MAKPKKPVSSGAKTTASKAAKTPDKVEVSTPPVEPKPVTSAKPVATSADKTTTSSASKASATATPKPDVAGKTPDAKPVAEKPDAGKVGADGDAPKAATAKPDPKAAIEKPSDPKPIEKPTTPPQAKSEPSVVRPTSASAPVAEKSSGFVPLVLGGVIAAALGFAASEANFMGWRTQDDSLRTSLVAQQEEINALKEAGASEIVQSAPDLSGIEGSLGNLTEQVAALDTRIAEIEAQPTVVAPLSDGGVPVEDVRAELTAMQAALEAQRSEIEGLLGTAKTVEEAAAAAARAAAGQRALAHITSAISNGGGYADTIDEMTAAGITDIPAALTNTATDGVVTLINLQSRFPDVARAALADARSSTTDTENNGVGGFLRRQLGARSVTPREGSDPDAILSRAEAAVRDGRVSEALTEVDALPDGTKDAMQGWIADAQVRADAEAAVQDLSQRLTVN